MERQTLLAYAVGAIGLLASAAAGYVTITTPEAAACQVQLADRNARLELTERAMTSCSTALDLCSGVGP